MTVDLQALRATADALRRHSLRATAAAGSGHPTSCLSAADIMAAVFFADLRFDPHAPAHPANDRFVLSKGHAAPLLYAALAEAGALSMEDLPSLRQFSSDLEGHPTPRLPWVGAATGSLGQGLSVGVGMALAGKRLDDLEYRVTVLLGDGEVAEGGVWEAAAMASHYALDNLTAIIDVNGMGQSGPTMYDFDVETYRGRFSAFGWHAVAVDGHDLAALVAACKEARAMIGRPTVLVARTLKGKGVSFLEDKPGWHGKPVKGEDLDKALAELPNGHPAAAPAGGRPPAYEVSPTAPCGEVAAPAYTLGEKVATRVAYGTALAKLGAVDDRIVALDGDTKNSTFAETFLQAHPERYFESYIAEQNMVGAAVGLAACGKIPFASTFAAFLTRAFDHIRMAAISGVAVKYAGSHCGVSIGEDGPSQMGLEDMAMMRAIPDSVVLYPSDAVSSERLVSVMADLPGTTYLRTTRPATPVLYPNDEAFPVGGSKLLRSSENDAVTVVAAGVTVHEALAACETLAATGPTMRLIDAYSVKPLDAEAILAAARATRNTVLVVEDHYFDGGLGDAVLNAVAVHDVKVHKLAVTGVPRSGTPDELLDACGISARHIAVKVGELAA